MELMTDNKGKVMFVHIAVTFGPLKASNTLFPGMTIHSFTSDNQPFVVIIHCQYNF